MIGEVYRNYEVLEYREICLQHILTRPRLLVHKKHNGAHHTAQIASSKHLLRFEIIVEINTAMQQRLEQHVDLARHQKCAKTHTVCQIYKAPRSCIVFRHTCVRRSKVHDVADENQRDDVDGATVIY